MDQVEAFREHKHILVISTTYRGLKLKFQFWNMGLLLRLVKRFLDQRLIFSYFVNV